MTKRQNIISGTKWEEIVGYSRAVRVGNIIEVAGTTAVDKTGAVIGIDDPYAQASYIFTKIGQALAEVGGCFEDVVRTRMYVVDIAHWEEIGRAHGEFFREIKPAATLVEVKSLILPELLVEIEVTAILTD
jgi:enamine deaminase RidA (YjgF/YER057c/UK114 family)